jgi:hypothetical protein
MVVTSFVVSVGAAKRPEVEISPTVVVHWTAVLLVPLMLAVNCSIPPEDKVAVEGETTTVTAELATFNESIFWPPPPLESVTDTVNE